MTKLFTPNSTDLNNMIAAAMAKCDRHFAHIQEQAEAKAAQERASLFEAAIAHNRKVIAARREHDMRRRLNAGDRP